MTEAVSTLPGRRHRWGERVITVAIDSPDGCEHQARKCHLCGMTCITIIAPVLSDTRHEWVTKDGMRAPLSRTPPCLGVEP